MTRVDAARLGTFGGDAGPGPAADDRLARFHLRMQALQNLITRKKAHPVVLAFGGPKN